MRESATPKILVRRSVKAVLCSGNRIVASRLQPNAPDTNPPTPPKHRRRLSSMDCQYWVRRTEDFAKKHGKPWLHLSERGSYESANERLAASIRKHNVKVPNVASSRESKEPGVAVFVKRALEDAFFPRVEERCCCGVSQRTHHSRQISLIERLAARRIGINELPCGVVRGDQSPRVAE